MMKRRRKENYGFNEFNSVKFISIFMMSISISILLLSIGFSSFNKNLVMSNAKVMVRADKDVRISGIKVKGKVKTYSNGEVVYFNVDNGTKCTSSEAVSTTGTKSGCMKFYAFNDDGGETVNLILDHNTTAKVAWNSSGSNASGPKELLIQLKSDTEKWQGTETPSNYTMDQTGETSNAKYTIDYSGYKARLITAQEVATITGYTGWDEKVSASNYYYFDSKTTTASDTCKSGNTSGCSYGWLYDRTNTNCTKYGCLNNSDQETYGYWTASSRAAHSSSAWYVLYRATVDNDGVGSSLSRGVRPVITVAKDKLANEGLSGAISNNEEYLDSSIYGDITLPTSDSTITYEVEVTNLGNVKVAIADITNEESRLAYELEDYTLGDTICDTNNACTNGIKKKIYVTLKYKDGVTPTTSSIPFNLKFDFEQVYTVTYDGITCDGCKTEALGNSPFTVTISMLNPKVIMNERELTSSEYSYVNGLLTINNVDGDIIIKEGSKIYKNGEIVYFNVTTGNMCTSSNYIETQSNTGTKSGCMKFYAFNDDGKDTINLILDHNTTATVAWNSSKSNTKGPKEVLDQLKTDTDGWKGTITPSNYTMDQTGQTSNAKYTIDYSSYKARLITANEIAQITGNTTWNEKTANNNYYLDSKTTTASDTCKEGNISGCKYGWLYDRTNSECTKNGCLNKSDKETYGYWTASSRAARSTYAWRVYYDGVVDYGSVGFSGACGVRPVIEVLKSKLVVKDYNVTTNLTNVNGDSSNATSITNIETKILKFIANSGYTLPEKVTVTGATYTWNKATGELTLSEVNGDIIVTIVGEEIKTYTNGEIVYFDVTTGTKCSNYTESQSNIGVNSGCMKFYAFNDNGGDTLNLILDHNTTAKVAWNSSKSNVSGPNEVLIQLKTDTSSWKGTETPMNYTMDQSTQSSKAKYTIDYSSYKARLITAQEVAIITENTSWDEKVASNSNWYYFHSKSSTGGACTSGCTYGWLYDRTNTNCTNYGCLNNSDQKGYGYWTASSRASNSTYAWIVYYYGYVHYDGVVASSYRGVRPVITVLKSKL